MSLTTSENGDVTLSKARHNVCLYASWELEAIALMLPGCVERSCDGEMANYLRVRCLAGRVRELTNALIAGLNDDMVPVEGLGELSDRVMLDRGEG